MKGKFELIFTIFLLMWFIAPLYAQQPARELCDDKPQTNSTLSRSVSDYLQHERYYSDTPQKPKFSIIALFKSKAFASVKSQDDERKKLREEWKEALGLDVFYPYFKAKDVEDYIQKKTSVNLFNMRGKAEYSQDTKQIKYIFKRRF